MRKRTKYIEIDNCPICGKSPYVDFYGVNSGSIWCKGYGMYRHKMLSANISYSQQIDLLKEMMRKWNNLKDKCLRELFD